MLFRLHVADRETGEESTYEAECESVQVAREQAQTAGYLVSSVEPRSVTQSSPAAPSAIKPAQPRKLNFLERAKQKQAELECDLTPEQLRAKRKKEKLIGMVFLLFLTACLPFAMFIGNRAAVVREEERLAAESARMNQEAVERESRKVADAAARAKQLNENTKRAATERQADAAASETIQNGLKQIQTGIYSEIQGDEDRQAREERRKRFMGLGIVRSVDFEAGKVVFHGAAWERLKSIPQGRSMALQAAFDYCGKPIIGINGDSGMPVGSAQSGIEVSVYD